MCKWGTETVMRLTIPARLSRTGKKRKKLCGIDSCIASIVRALNKGGVSTDACCCGHGKRPGVIMLADGRELFIAPDYKTGRKIDKAFPDIWGQKR